LFSAFLNCQRKGYDPNNLGCEHQSPAAHLAREFGDGSTDENVAEDRKGNLSAVQSDATMDGTGKEVGNNLPCRQLLSL
jgi:hypothetical protein